MPDCEYSKSQLKVNLNISKANIDAVIDAQLARRERWRIASLGCGTPCDQYLSGLMEVLDQTLADYTNQLISAYNAALLVIDDIDCNQEFSVILEAFQHANDVIAAYTRIGDRLFQWAETFPSTANKMYTTCRQYL